MKKVGLIAKKHNQEAFELAAEVGSWLNGHGVATFSLERNLDFTGEKAEQLRDSDLVLVFGGDGTMINAAKHMVDLGVPLAGINLGRVGFLLELSRHNWREALLNALQNGFDVEPRMVLRCDLERDGEVICSELATNEIVISRGGMARLIALDLAVNGNKLLYLRADGLIVSTPTGTTAYASSAGGPLLHPSLNAYCATAICPFLNRLQPLVLNGETVFTAKVREISPKTYLTIDGQSLSRLHGGDVINVRGVPGGLKFGLFGVGSYYSKLQSTGIVRDSPGEQAGK